jgi:general secretion pathway protein H
MVMHVISATGSRGFTLLELLVVLTIIALIASAWPLASSRLFANQHLRDESQILANSLRAAQMTARTTGIQQVLKIAQDGAGWEVGSERHELPQAMTLQVLADEGDRADRTLQLHADGSSSGAELRFSLNEHTIDLRVYPVTSRIEVR